MKSKKALTGNTIHPMRQFWKACAVAAVSLALLFTTRRFG